MGAKPCSSANPGNKSITIAILGLDNAGKTTTTRALEKKPDDDVIPTMGYSQSEISHKNSKIKLIDLGGAKNFRESWRHYYDDAHGFVYVLDSSETERLKENREVLRRLLQEEKVKGKPILILANKQDKPDALDKNAIMEDLKVERLVNESQTLCRVELCAAKSLKRDSKHSKMDESIRHGFDWLIKVIDDNFEKLQQRVEHDVQKRRDTQEKEKRERNERVKKLREEREKEEGAQENENDVDEETIKKGFVPIGQAVKNAERNLPEKSKTPIDRPIPAPRSTSHQRKFLPDQSNDEEERPRRHSSEFSSRKPESPVPRSQSSRFDDDDTNNSDEQTPVRSTTGKKKKLLGPSRPRHNGDQLPPLAPSSAASRREDFPLTKGPPMGTPRPGPLAAPWAITSQAPQAPGEKLMTINSDNELDADDSKLSRRIVSPHPITAHRIRQEKKTNNDDDGGENENHRRPSSTRKTPSRYDDDDENETGQRSNRRPPSASRRTNGAGDSSSRSRRTARDDDDD